MRPSPLHATATALLGAALLLGAGLPAEAAPAAVEVRGVVTVDGRPVPDVLVGTYGAGNTVLSKGRTDAAGAFSLRTPRSVPVLVVAGRNPSNAHAVFAAGDEHLVVGVIGAAAPKGVPAALAEQVTRVTPARLGGGARLRFRLERAGRLEAPIAAGGTGRIRLQRDPAGPGWTADGGTTTSGWLVPGGYDLLWEPDAQHLPARTRVRVGSGTTAIVAPVLQRGTTVRLQLSAGGAPAPAGVPVVDGTGFVRTSDAQGRVTAEGLAPGVHRFTAGTTARAANGAGAPAGDFLPAAVAVRAAADQEAVEAAVALTPAARITGRVAVRLGSTTRVVAQDDAGVAVSAVDADADGRFALGGLPAGAYTVVADDLRRHVHDRVAVTVAAGSSVEVSRTLTPAVKDAVVSGTIVGGRKAHVVLRAGGADAGVATWLSSRYAASYRVAVPPGRYTAETISDRRLPVTGVRLTVLTDPVRRDLRVGAPTSSGSALFTVHGQKVRPRFEAVSRTGAVLRFDGNGNGGRSTSNAGALGRYSWTTTRGTAPAVDGPWTFVPPKGGLTLKAGRTTDLGRFATSIRE